jgi:hypothetical protein
VEVDDVLISMKHFGNVGVGVTSPQLFRANDRKFYVVKLQNNQLGSKVLVSEFLAAKFGEYMGLCFPKSNIIEITEQTIQQSPQLMASGVLPGQHFASQFLNHTEYVVAHNLCQANNITEMAGVILFDYMFHNADRTNNKKNLLLRRENSGYKIYAIDNSHLFRSSRWTIPHLNNVSKIIKPYYRYSYGLLLRNWLSALDFIPYVEQIRNMRQEYIDNLVKEIPEEWLPDDAERQALKEYITLRRDMVEDIVEVVYRHIPQSRGGYQWWVGSSTKIQIL